MTLPNLSKPRVLRPRVLRLVVVASAVALAALSPAPIIDRSAAQPYHPEQSQRQLETEQRFNGKHGIVGSVQLDERRQQDLSESGQPGAGDAVASASRASDSAKVISEASARVQGGTPEHRGFPWWLLAALFGGGAFAAAKGLRTWADRAVPTPDHIR